MKKNLLSRCLIGAPIGFTISFLITIFASLSAPDGRFHAVHPDLVALCGTEARAVALQAGVMLLCGAVYGGLSLLWETDWSFTGITLAHFAICSLVTLPVAYCMHWMHHSLVGALKYFALFAFIYAVIWLSTYLAIARKLRAINKKVEENR